MLTEPLKPLFLLGDEMIDRDHRGLVAQFRAVIDGDDLAFPLLLRSLFTHTEQHFDRENELMAKHRYRGLRDHKQEHTRVLREFQRGIERVERGQLTFGRTFVREQLLPWFEQHVSSMDYVLVMHLQKQLEDNAAR
jgi:hemerythrin